MKSRPFWIAGVCLAVVVAGCSSSQSSSDSTAATVSANQHVFETDHFAAGAIIGDVTNAECTLSGGTTTTCASVTIAGYPVSYKVGPFCPDSVTTAAKDAGIWFDGNGIYDIDGAFIKNLADFYNDSKWKLFDSKGNVNVTDTKEAFEGAARPDVATEYQNHCVEGQLAWLPNGKPVQTTIQIPLTPIKASSASSGHPGNFGITFDGVVIAESAPVDAILGAHTIAAFDDCGGHYNPVAGYHLHGVTGCGHLDGDFADDETQMFGYAADGFPIHLPLSDAGLKTTTLDECNGHSTASEGYHYHANSAAKNAILPCLMGEYVSNGAEGGRPQGPPPGNAQSNGTQSSAGIDVVAIAAQLGVTTHELEDAMATGNIDSAAKMLGTTAAALAKKLGVTIADLKAALSKVQPIASSSSSIGTTTPQSSSAPAMTSTMPIQSTTTSSIGGASIVNTWIGPPIDTTKLPIGTSQASLTSAKIGGLYSCSAGNPNGGGSGRLGPWINEANATWNMSLKASVQGSVSWPMASYSEVIIGTSRQIRSNGLPVKQVTGVFPIASSDPAYQYDGNPNSIASSDIAVSLPVNPSKAASVSCLGKGRIGILKNGVSLFASLDAQNRDAIVYETQDKCDGHPQQQGTYHYHAIPSCVRNAATGSSTVVGFANDGFPIVVERNAKGELPTNADLDKCHGRTSNIELDGKVVSMYHYSTTYEFPYFIGCYTGTPVS